MLIETFIVLYTSSLICRYMLETMEISNLVFILSLSTSEAIPYRYVISILGQFALILEYNVPKR